MPGMFIPPITLDMCSLVTSRMRATAALTAEVIRSSSMPMSLGSTTALSTLIFCSSKLPLTVTVTMFEAW